SRCPKGYAMLDGSTCTDINECEVFPNICQGGGLCVNTDGSYQCNCPPGLTLDHTGTNCYEIYCENEMTDGMVRKWGRQFNDECTNVHDEARSGRPSVVNDGLVANVNEKIRENRRFTIRMLCDEFPQISKTVLHETITNCVPVGFRKCLRMSTKRSDLAAL
ncbi:hypothetical protein AVEN_91029-1, partial [Araneus ventricosus]